ncbi:hypothetical protein C2869_09750 [Saccharobesus litoralis]|uniref:STAS domain-containing protein n=1 Tax=Saccharobesus litoralis TaxID=2172099 RepID=A0A2S0VR55_9ALTE|nr:STAS domain-containing protein [Saccharobesus litoralis]AWB66696.1 hypothetical protein C2869_09750 [Saccharobesus litoralis]
MADEVIIELGATATIAQAEALLQEFNEIYILGRCITVDASKVEKVDSAVLQLLVSLKKSLAVDDNRIIWREPSQVFVSSATAVGLDEYLELN